MMVMPELDIELCDGCGLCIIACHGGGIVWKESKVSIIETGTCDYCGVCEMVCPRGAIKCFYVILASEE